MPAMASSFPTPTPTPPKFQSTLTIVNNGLDDLKSWQVFVGFQHNEYLVAASNAVLADGTSLPAGPRNDTLFAGCPSTDLKTAFETAGDMTQTSAQIDLVGTQFGVGLNGAPMPSNLSLVNDGEFRPSEVAAVVTISAARETQTVDTEKEISPHSTCKKERVIKCVELINESSLASGFMKGPGSSVPSVPQSPIGVLHPACLSYKYDGTAVGSCPSSSHSTPDSKSSYLNCDKNTERSVIRLKSMNRGIHEECDHLVQLAAVKTGTALPNMGCAWEEAVAVEAAEVNMKMESNEPLVGVDDPNTIGALLVAATETEDAPKENPVDGDAELNVELNEGMCRKCQRAAKARLPAGCPPAKDKLKKSMVADIESGKSVESKVRISSGMLLNKAQILRFQNSLDRMLFLGSGLDEIVVDEECDVVERSYKESDGNKVVKDIIFGPGEKKYRFCKAETLEDLYKWKAALEEALALAPSATLVMGQNGIFRNDQADTFDGYVDQLKDRQPVKSLVIGRPILLALEDIDGTPSFLEKALRFVEEHVRFSNVPGVKVEGILLQAAYVDDVERRIREYEQGKNDFSSEEDAHVIADCVKYVLRELPSSPVPASCCNALLETRTDRGRRVAAMREAICETFPEPNRRLLQR
ncbi:unnamed protein product [Camellia sinensis]